ncbi:hypothetical protein MOQ_009285 [Trypanosoma cruzi marinkellei]|uniref:Uncharacterized protein n=1 Tax=Trypanosoma cruzi marinkellei TaxID=85056 RepID=K2ND75_TRYCR|nr:hypothetical protein MOQ_009285 [Trypanosoma cruzi marinkellei]
MLGLCCSLSLPSLLPPLDPVTRRRLCVRGALTAATRESIEIRVVGGVRLVFSEPSNFTVAIIACFPSFLACLFKEWKGPEQQQYITQVSGEQRRAPTQRAGHKTIRKGQHGGPSPTEKKSDTHARCEESTDPLAGTAPTRSAKPQRHALPLRTDHHGRHGGTSVRAGQPSRGATRLTPNREVQTDRQRERWMDAVKTQSRSTWPVSMRQLPTQKHRKKEGQE